VCYVLSSSSSSLATSNLQSGPFRVILTASVSVRLRDSKSFRTFCQSFIKQLLHCIGGGNICHACHVWCEDVLYSFQSWVTTKSHGKENTWQRREIIGSNQCSWIWLCLAIIAVCVCRRYKWVVMGLDQCWWLVHGCWTGARSQCCATLRNKSPSQMSRRLKPTSSHSWSLLSFFSVYNKRKGTGGVQCL